MATGNRRNERPATAMTVKAKEEERLLRREFGAAGHGAYAARTRMLPPLPR
jgi:protein-S-isoprenylcysteine O-methyltransferase Ste14